jgi:hypothetical protein
MKRAKYLIASLALAAYSFWYAFWGNIPVDNQIAMFFMGCFSLALGVLSLIPEKDEKGTSQR